MTTRYHGHLALSEFDPVSQKRLEGASVLLIGLGGVGCPVAQYLAAAGVGRLLLCDYDRVSESNLSRQILYRENDVGKPKTQAAAAALTALNSAVNVEVYGERITAASAAAVGASCQLWIDTSDNWATRMAINEAALALIKPWVMAAAIRREGQLALFQPGSNADSACYACLYGNAAHTMDNCAGAGVLSTVAGSVGLAAAQVAMAQLTGGQIVDDLKIYDGQRLHWQSLSKQRNPSCDVCRP